MAAVSGWRSATTACLNESQWKRLFRLIRTTFHLCPFHSFLSVPAGPLTMKPARSTRISLARNCDRFLHTYRIPQAVPRILAIPRASRASQRRKKRYDQLAREWARNRNDKDKAVRQELSTVPFKRLQECEPSYIEYLFSFSPTLSAAFHQTLLYLY